MNYGLCRILAQQSTGNASRNTGKGINFITEGKVGFVGHTFAIMLATSANGVNRIAYLSDVHRVETGLVFVAEVLRASAGVSCC